MKKTIIGLIKIYQKCMSPFLGQTCRFYPSCSRYSEQVILKYGPVKGTFLSFKRIMKCHPLHPGGYDPAD